MLRRTVSQSPEYLVLRKYAAKRNAREIEKWASNQDELAQLKKRKANGEQLDHAEEATLEPPKAPRKRRNKQGLERT